MTPIRAQRKNLPYITALVDFSQWNRHRNVSRIFYYFYPKKNTVPLYPNASIKSVHTASWVATSTLNAGTQTYENRSRAIHLISRTRRHTKRRQCQTDGWWCGFAIWSSIVFAYLRRTGRETRVNTPRESCRTDIARTLSVRRWCGKCLHDDDTISVGPSVWRRFWIHHYDAT